jgi:L-aspartate oxidase
MSSYTEKGALAPRDVVSRAIAFELKKSKEKCVFLDCTIIEKQTFIHHFPNIYKKCLANGIDISKQMIPVVPAAHYICGGIKTDHNGKTNIENLYACGESSCTGLHGANRLASNSLLEALVFAHRSFLDVKDSIKFINNINSENIKAYPKYFLKYSNKTNELRKEINEAMSLNLGIIREKASMTNTLSYFQHVSEEIYMKLKSGVFSWQLMEVNNMLTVAILITQASLNRTENKGLFFSIDNKTKEHSHNIILP